MLTPRAVFLRRLERRMSAGVQVVIVVVVFALIGVVAGRWFACGGPC